MVPESSLSAGDLDPSPFVQLGINVVAEPPQFAHDAASGSLTIRRAHRSCLVNVGQISEIVPGDTGTYRIVFRDEKRSSVPLSRRQARKLRERFPW